MEQQQSQLQDTPIAQQGPQSVEQQSIQPPLPLVNVKMMIQRLTHEFNEIQLPNLLEVDIPNEHREEFNQLLNQLFQQCNDVGARLPMVVAVLKHEEIAWRSIEIIGTMQHQQQMLTKTSGPCFVVNLDTLRTMSSDMQQIIEHFIATTNVYRASMNQGQQTEHQEQQDMVNNPTPVFPQNLSMDAAEN